MLNIFSFKYMCLNTLKLKNERVIILYNIGNISSLSPFVIYIILLKHKKCLSYHKSLLYSSLNDIIK